MFIYLFNRLDCGLGIVSYDLWDTGGPSSCLDARSPYPRLVYFLSFAYSSGIPQQALAAPPVRSLSSHRHWRLWERRTVTQPLLQQVLMISVLRHSASMLTVSNDRFKVTGGEELIVQRLLSRSFTFLTIATYNSSMNKWKIRSISFTLNPFF
jgi:hypothetical protein